MTAHIYIDQNGRQHEQSVLEHMEGTARIAKHFGSMLNMGCLAYLTAILHDLGKWRVRFDEYLRKAVSGKGRAYRGEVNHSSAGAVYVYQRYYKGNAAQKLTAQLAGTAILSHHGLNDCMTPMGIDRFHQRVENLEGLDYEEVIRNFTESTLSGEALDRCFAAAVKEVEAMEIRLSELSLHNNFSISMLERMLLSILIDADRLDTAIFCGDRDEVDFDADGNIPWDELCDHLEGKLVSYQAGHPVSTKEAEIYRLRRQVADECLEFAGRPNGIYRLAVPTGGAKTLSSMRFALNHAKLHGKKRILYIGPYLSILEQNSQVFREALGHEEMILEHHSNVVAQDPEQEERTELDCYKHLTQNWDSPVILTTFVQFLNTIFAGGTQSVRRFHSLTDSVIIIDEIQSLPVKMIHLFNMAMNYLNAVCSATVILCSATQPVLTKVRLPIRMSEPPDMIADVDDLYRRLKRVRVEVRGENLDTEGLRDFIASLMKDQRDLLVILNTKKAVRLLYRELASYYGQEDEPVRIIHLSTSMCAEHRLHQIKELRNNLGHEKIICVSTSLIEAGVDLSFSCVIRSFAGLDSVAQAAGRCNRNGEGGEGRVFLIHYQEEKLGMLRQVKIGAQCSETVAGDYLEKPEKYQGDLLSREALNEFYGRYYYDGDQRRLMDYPLEDYGSSMVDLLCNNNTGKKGFINRNGRDKNPDLRMFQAFSTAGKEFEVIDQNTTGVIVPYGKGGKIIERLNGTPDKKEVYTLFRQAQRFTVDIYQNQLEQFHKKGVVYRLSTGGVMALADGFYDKSLGITGEGIQEFLDV